MGCSCSRSRRQSEKALQIIDQVCADDQRCTRVVIRPQDNLRKSDIRRLLEGLRTNTHVKYLTLAGLGLKKDEGLLLAQALEQSNIERLNVADNNFNGRVIMRIVEVITKRNVVKVLSIHDQRNWTPNHSELEDLVDVLKHNPSLHTTYSDLVSANPMYHTELLYRLSRDA